jgi:hypothetical protein
LNPLPWFFSSDREVHLEGLYERRQENIVFALAAAFRSRLFAGSDSDSGGVQQLKRIKHVGHGHRKYDAERPGPMRCA